MNALVESQRAFFLSGATQSYAHRRNQLFQLRQLLLKGEDLILEALSKDLAKPATEAWTSEIGAILCDIDFMLGHLHSFMKPHRVGTTLINQPGKSFWQFQPYGVSMIVGPWNYPIGLCLAPLVGALAAGNCAILKPSEMAPYSSECLSRLVGEHFDSRNCSVVRGGPETVGELIDAQVDFVFFTGGIATGRTIMRAASQHLIPVALELGGKNPCIVDDGVPVTTVAQRLAWGKFFNAGQTCIAPDTVYVHESIAEKLIASLRTTITNFYGTDPLQSGDMASIVNKRHFDRLVALIDSSQVVLGGRRDVARLRIEPTLVVDPPGDSPLFREELFGPILPIVRYRNLPILLQELRSSPPPLMVYCFTKNRTVRRQVTQETRSGGVCINGTIHRLISSTLPFGGLGQSGMGRYHGEAGFTTFSYRRSTLEKSFVGETRMSYPPYRTPLSVIRRIRRYLF